MRRVKILISILKNCLVNNDRFKRHILCFELKTVEKYDVLEQRIFKAARDESYLQLAYLEEKDRRTKIGSFNLYSCRCACKLGESNTDKAFTQHKHDKYGFANKCFLIFS